MGWGNITPLFNKLHSYWPLKDLIDINPNFYVVDVGKVSSDHDRACEAFYQLYGGQVDYGEEHSKSCGTDFSISCDIYVYIYITSVRQQQRRRLWKGLCTYIPMVLWLGHLRFGQVFSKDEAQHPHWSEVCMIYHLPIHMTNIIQRRKIQCICLVIRVGQRQVRRRGRYSA
jgi:hypothetical protein